MAYIWVHHILRHHSITLQQKGQKTLKLSNQLQQQLHYVHTELQKIAQLKLKQQMLTREQLLLLPHEHYGSYTDFSRSAQIPTTIDPTNKTCISNRFVHTAQTII